MLIRLREHDLEIPRAFAACDLRRGPDELRQQIITKSLCKASALKLTHALFTMPKKASQFHYLSRWHRRPNASTSRTVPASHLRLTLLWGSQSKNVSPAPR